MFKKTFAVAAACLLLVGCASSTEPEATVTVTESAAPSVEPQAVSTPESSSTDQGVDMGEVKFIRALRNSDETFDPNADESLLTIGRGFCEMYDGGAESSDINEFILNGMGFAYTLKQLTSVHGYAVGALCPEHIDKLS